MKKGSINLATFLIVGCLAFTACKKKTEDPEPEPTPTTTGGTPATGGFTWTPSGGSATVADSAFYYQMYNTIHAYKNGSANHFEINLTGLAVATYSIGSGNDLTYVMGTTYMGATSGQVNITANANNKLSGNFNTPLSGGSITSVAGQFVDIPKK
ncbi:MAG: hypothetical protein V4565_01130 [Bacteroidota bacterium]